MSPIWRCFITYDLKLLYSYTDTNFFSVHNVIFYFIIQLRKTISCLVCWSQFILLGFASTNPQGTMMMIMKRLSVCSQRGVDSSPPFLPLFYQESSQNLEFFFQTSSSYAHSQDNDETLWSSPFDCDSEPSVPTQQVFTFLDFYACLFITSCRIFLRRSWNLKLYALVTCILSLRPR